MIETVQLGGYPLEVQMMPRLHPMAGERIEPLTMDEARKLYREFWQLATITHPEHGVAFCYCCGQPATGRSSANAWGTILDFPSCDGCHARWNVKWVDSVPCAWGKPGSR